MLVCSRCPPLSRPQFPQSDFPPHSQPIDPQPSTFPPQPSSQPKVSSLVSQTLSSALNSTLNPPPTLPNPSPASVSTASQPSTPGADLQPPSLPAPSVPTSRPQNETVYIDVEEEELTCEIINSGEITDSDVELATSQPHDSPVCIDVVKEDRKFEIVNSGEKKVFEENPKNMTNFNLPMDTSSLLHGNRNIDISRSTILQSSSPVIAETEDLVSPSPVLQSFLPASSTAYQDSPQSGFCGSPEVKVEIEAAEFNLVSNLLTESLPSESLPDPAVLGRKRLPSCDLPGSLNPKPAAVESSPTLDPPNQVVEVRVCWVFFCLFFISIK